MNPYAALKSSKTLQRVCREQSFETICKIPLYRMWKGSKLLYDRLPVKFFKAIRLRRESQNTLAYFVRVTMAMRALARQEQSVHL